MAKKRLPTKKILVTGGIVLLLAAAAGVGVWLSWYQKNVIPEEGSTVGLLEERLPADIREAQDLAMSGKTAEANQKLEEVLKQPNIEDDKKYEIYIQQGVNLENDNKLPEAMASYKKAEAIRQDFKVCRAIGDLAVRMNNRLEAIAYYKQALTFLNPNQTLYEFEKSTLESKIKELEG